MKKFNRLAAILTVFLLLTAGCSKKADTDTPDTGILIRVEESVLSVCNWSGTLSDSGDKVTIQATADQIAQLQADNTKIIIFFTESESVIDDVTIDSISGTSDSNGTKSVVLNAGQSLKDMGDFEVDLFINGIIVSKECIFEDEDGRYVWTVENDISNMGANTDTQSVKTAVKLVNPQKVYVKTGYSNEYRAEITAGLSEGVIIAKP